MSGPYTRSWTPIRFARRGPADFGSCRRLFSFGVFRRSARAESFHRPGDDLESTEEVQSRGCYEPPQPLGRCALQKANAIGGVFENNFLGTVVRIPTRY